MTENEEFIRTGYDKPTYEEYIARFNNVVRYPSLGGCPFCGNYDLSVESVGDPRSTAKAVVCNECDAEGPTAITAPKAGELWNTRTPKEDMQIK
ncbi:MAG: Lar family restriction alleviation protein, partial [Desulfatiglandales bacterium]